MSQRYGLEIRAATAADAASLARWLGGDGPSIDPRALAERIEALRADPGAVLVAVEWGPPSGLVALHWYRTLTGAARTAQITMLHVGADDRRRGLGRLLLKAAAQAARVAGCDAMEMTMPADRPDLRAFCAAAGFVEAGTCVTRPLRKKGPGA
ncbi:GNAT family N-acetyltransferase [uncultured Methylobacterium sp.]|uniref:GNAT family N-acetyltransferase n=1 Tax=uncultured Methylobacterium sp. TaxID=157278 RepID=UPI0035CBB841